MCFIGGWINSFLYRKYLRAKNRGWLFWFAILFLGGAITLDMLIYYNVLDIRIIPWINIPKNANPGKYYMFNPGLMFGLNLGTINPTDDLIWDVYALFFMISYIWWFTIGQNLSRFMYGRLTYEQGAWYILRTTKMIKRSKEKLEKQQEKES